MGLGRTAGWLAAAALLSFASLPAPAQSVAADLIPQGELSENCFEAGPAQWNAFLRAGPVLPLGGGFFNTGLEAGWGIQIGVQTRFWDLPASTGPWHIFGELGGSYASNGRNGPADITAGTFDAPPDAHTHSGGFFNTNVSDIQRTAFQAALGTRYFPLALNAPGRCAVQFNARVGFRAGAIQYSTSATPTAELLGVMAEHLAPTHNGGNPHDPALFRSQNVFENSSALFGVFTSLGVGVTCPDVRLGRMRLGEWTFGLEVEFAEDFINSDAFQRSHDGLGTITPLGTISIGF